jgi:lipoprotein-anchoring transpeptidase ErfK/SrfK
MTKPVGIAGGLARVACLVVASGWMLQAADLRANEETPAAVISIEAVPATEPAPPSLQAPQEETRDDIQAPIQLPSVTDLAETPPEPDGPAVAASADAASAPLNPLQADVKDPFDQAEADACVIPCDVIALAAQPPLFADDPPPQPLACAVAGMCGPPESDAAAAAAAPVSIGTRPADLDAAPARNEPIRLAALHPPVGAIPMADLDGDPYASIQPKPALSKALTLLRRKGAAIRPSSRLAVRTIDRRHEPNLILIQVAKRRLMYFLEPQLALEFPIGVARPNIQRYGTTRITEKRRDPTWVPTPTQRRIYRGLPGSVRPGPSNPLGTRALNLTIPNYRIHGTNDDSYIGMARSDGCFRMYNSDVEFLFDIVSVGTKVVIER